MVPCKEMDFDKHLSVEAKRRVPPTLRKLVAEFDGAEGIVSMHAGIPPSTAFPFVSFKATLLDGSEIEISDPRKVYAAQQYATESFGYGPLMKWISAHMKRMHSPPHPHEHLLTNGSNHLIEMALSMLLEHGDPVLCEEYTYSNILESTLMPKGYECVAVPMDNHGIIPAELRKVLEQRREAGLKIPSLLYTVPVAQNPTGAITSEERKRGVYEVCQEYDIIILEDDPYFYLQFGDESEGPPGMDPKRLGKSYLALDTDGRVIRTDSFSKILAPGFRTGWISAAKPFRDRLALYMLSSTMGTCSMTANIIYELLSKWGDEGLDAHLKRIQSEYAAKSRTIIAGFNEHMKGLGQWEAPRGGMFVWMKLIGIASSDSIIRELREEKVVIVPGHIFDVATGGQPKACPYIRLSCVAPIEELKEGVERLSRVIRSAQQKQQTEQNKQQSSA
uniref:Kynurenine/2-aminoadipate aminotransferase n=1 Tax=Tetraselmis sp. GSL018 TaxID=582737 RepID=A0A061S2W1_9CHLO